MEEADEVNSLTEVRHNSSFAKKAALKQSKNLEVAPSSYYKVSLSTEKAKRRQNSLGN